MVGLTEKKTPGTGPGAKQMLLLLVSVNRQGKGLRLREVDKAAFLRRS